MSIDIQKEQNRTISTQDAYDVIHFAIEASKDGDYINFFVFKRLLYIGLAIVIFKDREEEISSMVEENPLNAWDSLLIDGTIENLLKSYKNDCEYLADESLEWYNDYVTYFDSSRAIINEVLDSIQASMNNLAGKLGEVATSDNFKKVLAVADRLGIKAQ